MTSIYGSDVMAASLDFKYFSGFRDPWETNFDKICNCILFNLLSANPTKWSTRLKQFVGANKLEYFWPFCGVGA